MHSKFILLQEILEDVHESLATPDNTPTPTVVSSRNNKAAVPFSHKTANSPRKSAKNAAHFDSIAALTEIMDSSSNVTIPAAGSLANQNKDPDADTSSTKTEVEEMELDQFSDLEDNIRAHENVSTDRVNNLNIVSDSGPQSTLIVLLNFKAKLPKILI